MGITGLLSSLRSIISRVHVSKYKGLKVGIDAHCWLYRGSFSCSKEITEGIKTTKFIHYFLELLNLLQAEGVIPVIVFDGRPLPAKSMTNSQRRESKYQNKTMAREAEADGREDDAKSFYQRSFSGKKSGRGRMSHFLHLLHNIIFSAFSYPGDGVSIDRGTKAS
jgi:exonuclease 1